MSEERDRLLPQLEEARWRGRQADKEIAALKQAAEAAQQVRWKSCTALVRYQHAAAAQEYSEAIARWSHSFSWLFMVLMSASPL